MTESGQIIEALDSRVRRREDRRAFFTTALGAAAVTAGAFAFATPAAAQTVTDADILNFALNLEYLEAQFYSYAATGSGLAANLLTGTGTQGAVRGGRRVNFTDPVVARYAAEIAADEIAHVAFLRSAIGTTATVSQPAIDVSATPTSAFSNAARAAGLIGVGQTFDPYADDNSFLLGAFIFEDVGVTAYKGSAALIQNKTFLEAAAGILAVEAYHASIIRTTLYSKGVAVRAQTEAISNARDSLDGTSNLDQGVAGDGSVSNIVPTDTNSIALSRTPGQVLNIVYLNSAAVTLGGFFPAGVNGNIRTSAAN